MDILLSLWHDVAYAVIFTAVYMVIFLIAKLCKNLCTPYKISFELVRKDNFAVSLALCGYYLGTAIIFIGSLLGPSQGLLMDLAHVSLYALVGLGFLNLSQLVNDKIILHKICNVNALTEDRNIAVAAVEFGTYIATAIIAAGSIMGVGGGILNALLFFVIGQCSLFIFAKIYNLVSPYCIHAEVKKQNTAMGIAFGGTLIALSIIIFNGIAGDFQNWKDSLTYLVAVNIIAFIFLPLIRLIMNHITVFKDSLSREIVEDQNIGAGLLEACIIISFAVILKILL